MKGALDCYVTYKEEENLTKKKMCQKLCWSGYHKCYDNDEENLFMGIDKDYLKRALCKYLKNKFKCEMCPFVTDELGDFRKHFLENHRDHSWLNVGYVN